MSQVIPTPNNFLTIESVRGKHCISNLKINEEIQELIRKGHKVFHFGFGQSPFSPMNEVTDELSKTCHHNEYVPTNGIKSLRVAISKFHKKYDDLDIDPDNIVVTPGSKQALFLIISCLLNDVILISPCWLSYGEQCSSLGKTTHILLTTLEEEWKVTPANLEKLIKEKNVPCYSALILCSPDNPTSTCYSEEELKDIANVCRKYHIIVISDEIYARLKFDGNHQSISKFYPEGTIITTAVSKWAALGGWRLGYAIFPPQFDEIKKAVLHVGSNSYTCVSAPIQFAVTKMFEKERECSVFIESCTKILKAIGEHCHRELVSVGIKCLKPSGGYYLLPDFEIIRGGLKKCGVKTPQQLCERLFEEKQVVAMPAYPSFLRPEDELSVRLCFVNFDGAKALQALNLSSGEVTDEFIKTNCPLTVQGIDKIKEWVEYYKQI